MQQLTRVSVPNASQPVPARRHSMVSAGQPVGRYDYAAVAGQGPSDKDVNFLLLAVVWSKLRCFFLVSFFGLVQYLERSSLLTNIKLEFY